MTQATMHLFTLAEALAHQQNRAVPYSLREAVGHATGRMMQDLEPCMLCGEQLNRAPFYVVANVSQNMGEFSLCGYGGVCVPCRTSHDRADIQKDVEERAHLMFNEVAGRA